ncbi:hypothetical protein EP7_002321 [Isosphaeraceae bacterium EP7]
MRLLPARPLAVALVLLLPKSGPAQVPPAAPPGAGILQFDPIGPIDEARIAGLAEGSNPRVMTWPRAMTLALIRTRDAKPPRFESLDLDRMNELAKALGTDDFARFKADFLSTKAFSDPSADLMNLQARILVIDNTRRKVDFFNHLERVITELARVDASGLRQSDLDRFDTTLIEARRDLDREINRYRDGLDALKVSLGLSAHAPLIVDTSPLAGFREVFAATDRWFQDPRRNINDLDRFAERLPSIGEISIEGQSILGVIEREPDRLEKMLSLATRIALKNRREGEDSDALELRIRRQLRHLAEIRADYEGKRRISVRLARQLDAAQEQLIAPPGGEDGQTTLKMAGITQQIAENRDRLVLLWTAFRAERLALYRDLGLFPFEDWSAFYGQFTAHPNIPATPPPVQPEDPTPRANPVDN